jgi:hypothetical protein
MAVYRVDLLTDATDPVFDWLNSHVDRSELVRSVAFRTVKGWYFKCVFKRREDAEAFHRHWLPDADDHTVSPFGQAAPDSREPADAEDEPISGGEG